MKSLLGFTEELLENLRRVGEFVLACFCNYTEISFALLVACVLVVVVPIGLYRRRLKRLESLKGSLIDDEPVESLEGDRLGREGYVKALLELIRRADPSRSQVVGVYGEWGEGKTSVVRMAEHLSKDEENNQLRFVWFDPWEIVGQKDLNAELFKTIGSE